MEWQRTSLKQSQNKDIRLNNSDKSNFLVCIRICVCVCCIITTISTPIFFSAFITIERNVKKKVENNEGIYKSFFFSIWTFISYLYSISLLHLSSPTTIFLPPLSALKSSFLVLSDLYKELKKIGGGMNGLLWNKYKNRLEGVISFFFWMVQKEAKKMPLLLSSINLFLFYFYIYLFSAFFFFFDVVLFSVSFCPATAMAIKWQIFELYRVMEEMQKFNNV